MEVESNGNPIGNAKFYKTRWRSCGARSDFGSFKPVSCWIGGAMNRYSKIGNSSANAMMNLCRFGTGKSRRIRRTRSRCFSASIIPSSSSAVMKSLLSTSSMMRGSGGECASISATGVPRVQTRERRRWWAEASMRCRHRWQTFTSLYHQRSRAHPPSCRIRVSRISSSSKMTGRQR